MIALEHILEIKNLKHTIVALHSVHSKTFLSSKYHTYANTLKLQKKEKADFLEMGSAFFYFFYQ